MTVVHLPAPVIDPERTWVCRHEERTICVRTYINGSRIYGHQCLNCGSWGAVKKEAIDPSRRYPDYEPAIAERWNAARNQIHAERREADQIARDEEREQRKRDYALYLETPEWQERRRKVLVRAKGICEACLEARATEVHHETYAHVFDEPLFELRAICRDCHERITAIDKAAKR